MTLKDIWRRIREFLFKKLSHRSLRNTNFLIGYRKRSKIHYGKKCLFSNALEKIVSLSSIPFFSNILHAGSNKSMHRITDFTYAARLRRGQASIIWHLSLRQLCPVVSFPFPVGLILIPLIAGTQWDIAAGGESIFTRPEIDRPRNESPMRRARAGLQRRRDAHPHPQWNFLTLLTHLHRQRFE